MKVYQPLTGPAARRHLQSMGYEVRGTDEKDKAFLGLIVALAHEIERLRREVEQLKVNTNP